MILKIPGCALLGFRKIWRRLRMYLLLPLFKERGKNIWLDPDGLYSFENISLGSDVFLGQMPILMAAESKIRIGNKVMFGPGVTLLGGKHNIAEIGRFMFDVKEKRPGDDQDIVIEDDIWIGSKAIILQGVTIGRGSIVAAGSVVTKSIPAYSVAVGCPARVLRFRWDLQTILRHEQELYRLEDRISESQLKAAFDAHSESRT